MANQRRQFRRSSTPNRSWGGAFSTANVAVAANTKILLGSFTPSNPNIDETVLRTVGSIWVGSDQTGSVEDVIGAFGLIIVTDLALAAGAASIPGPITDIADDGWFVYQPFVGQFRTVSAAGYTSPDGTEYQFDSKAKRRTGEGQSIAIMVQNASASHGFNIKIGFRLLSMVTGT